MGEHDKPFDFDIIRRAVDDPKVAAETVKRASEIEIEEASRKQNGEEERLRKELAGGGIEIEFSASSEPEQTGVPKKNVFAGRGGFDYGKVQSELEGRGDKFEGQLGHDSNSNN